MDSEVLELAGSEVKLSSLDDMDRMLKLTDYLKLGLGIEGLEMLNRDATPDTIKVLFFHQETKEEEVYKFWGFKNRPSSMTKKTI